MGTNVRSVLAGVLDTIANVTRSIANAGQQVVDFAYVRVLGLPFVVLGYRQTGKTTLLEYLRKNPEYLKEFEPEPTAAGGEPVPTFTTKLDDEGFRLRPKRDVGGEYSMWDTDWVDLFQQTKPRGVIFMIDHSDPYHHKDALNFVMNMIEDEASARRHLKTFLLLVNKSDLWHEELELNDILMEFRNETRRLESQAERLGFTCIVRESSLMQDGSIRPALTTFFNSIRPKARETVS